MFFLLQKVIYNIGVTIQSQSGTLQDYLDVYQRPVANIAYQTRMTVFDDSDQEADSNICRLHLVVSWIQSVILFISVYQVLDISHAVRSTTQQYYMYSSLLKIILKHWLTDEPTSGTVAHQ